MTRRSTRVFATICLTAATILIPRLQDASAQHYYAYVACESEDEVHLVHFSNGVADVVQKISVGVWPAEIEGPHGVTVSPDGKYWFVTMAHGNPFGKLYKFETVSNRLVGQATLGLFPATMEISKSTGLLYAVNFNLHGDMTPSSVSVVDPGSMTELGKIETGVMPHGSRLSADGLKQYSVSMMDGQLHELDAVSLEVTKSLSLDGLIATNNDHANHAASATTAASHSSVKPTWVTPSPNQELVYVALNGADLVLEINVSEWKVIRSFKTGGGPYNLAVTSDGSLLVVSYKKDGTTGIWDLESGEELVRVKNSRRVTHGITITPDDRFAFVTAEGVGSEAGAVDIIDLQTHAVVSTALVGKQAGGIYFWRQTDEPVNFPGRR